jgi:hypothetical protein
VTKGLDLNQDLHIIFGQLEFDVLVDMLRAQESGQILLAIQIHL